MHFITLLILNLMRRKTRSILTAVGVAIAVGTTVALLGISDGIERDTVESFRDRDVEIVVVEDGVLDQLSSDLDLSMADKIQGVQGVASVAPGLLELLDYSKSGTVVSVLIQGWQPESLLFNNLEILEGRRFDKEEPNAVMLGMVLAKNINKRVGDTFKIQHEEFKVVGIFQSFNVFENGAAIVSLGELQRIMSRGNSVTGFSVVVDHENHPQITAEQVCERINALVDADGQPLGLSALPTREYAAGSMHIRIAHAMAWLTSAIAIFVGSIGMINTMLMSVVERIKEISILRAIGWRKSRVARMVLGECLLLCLVGAFIGSLAAISMVHWLTRLPAAAGFVAGNIAPAVIIKGWLMAAVLGLVGGAYPAYRAVQLLPSEGLAHE